MTTEIDADATGTTDEKIQLTAEAYDANKPDQLLTGTHHITVNDNVLCGDTAIQEKFDANKYGKKKTQYPLSERNLCQNCADAYQNQIGSHDTVFETLPTLDCGEWIEIITNEGETLTGRVKRTVDDGETPTRRITVVLSNEARKRWVTGRIDQEILLKRTEGEPLQINPPTLEDESYLECEGRTVTTLKTEITPPENNIDQQTRNVLNELESLHNDLITKARTHSSCETSFIVKGKTGITKAETELLTGVIEGSGYTVTNTIHATREDQGNKATIFIQCESLESIWKQ